MNLDYSNTRKSWYPDEDQRLYNAYKYRQATVLKLAQIHKREPARIIRRLTQWGLITKDKEQQQQKQPQDKAQEVKANNYSNKSPWTNEERQTLIAEYRMNELPLLSIAANHNRHPHDIVAEMKSLKLVKTLVSITGYNEYKLSSLYADKQKETRQINKDLKIKKTEENNPIVAIKREMLEMKAEINRLTTFINQVFGTYNNRK